MNSSAAALALSCLVMTACGSTVQLQTTPGSTAAGPGANAGLSVPGGSSNAISPGEVVSSGAAGNDASGGGSVGTGGGGATTAPGPIAGGAQLPVGVTSKSIYVGIPYAPGTNQQLAAVGAGALAGGDTRDYFNIVINDANKHGGILGHTIAPIFHTFNNDPNKTQAQGDEEECTDYTQDHKVYATFLSGGDDTSRSCLTHGGVSAMLTENLTTSTASTFARYPNYVELSTLDYDHAAQPWVAALVRQRYFTGWDATTGQPSAGARPKIGVITSDDPGIRKATQQSLLPALARAGHPVDPSLVAYITFPQTTNDDATAINDVRAAELKFFQNGVTHVIINDFAGGFMAFFSQDANDQHYYPRYGLSSQSGAQSLYSSGLVPKGQLNGAVGFGWDPALDLQTSDNPDNGPSSNSTRRTCLALFKRNGVTFSGQAEAQALAICDMVWSLRAILTAGGPVLTVNTFQVGISKVGRSFTDGSSLGTYLAPDHRAGAGIAADWSYVSGCDCMRYVGRPFQVS